jgi:hypothetical protein
MELKSRMRRVLQPEMLSLSVHRRPCQGLTCTWLKIVFNLLYDTRMDFLVSHDRIARVFLLPTSGHETNLASASSQRAKLSVSCRFLAASVTLKAVLTEGYHVALCGMLGVTVRAYSPYGPFQKRWILVSSKSIGLASFWHEAMRACVYVWGGGGRQGADGR